MAVTAPRNGDFVGVNLLDDGQMAQVDRIVAAYRPNYEYINVALVLDGEVVLTKTYGQNRLKQTDVYASVSKPVTAMIVMHLVSHVVGRLKPELTSYDALRACFPAGTVTGAPKIRSMEIIAELESDRRGPYAGTVGYFGHGGGMDQAIAIRTLVLAGDRYSYQAGAGIVADSDPAREHAEVLAKSAALEAALNLAQEGL